MSNTRNVSEPICYEFPLTKTMRLFLRFEQLMAQFDACAQEESYSGSLAALTTLADIYQLTMHIDLKSEVIRQADRMALQTITSADTSLQQQLTETQTECTQLIQDIPGQLGNHLKNHYFFNLIRQRLSMPGGVSAFDLPLSHFWLNRPHRERQQLLVRWTLPYFQINKAISQLLKNTRAMATEAAQTATDGYFLQNLKPENGLQILQVLVDDQILSYPEISSGRQRITIRFFDLADPAQRSTQAQRDIEFKIRYCG